MVDARGVVASIIDIARTRLRQKGFLLSGNSVEMCR